MKQLHFAIASIVDANTGFGYVHDGKADYREEELRARAIRSKSVHAFFGAIAGVIRDAVAGYRERARQRKAVNDLLQLNDHYLEDIGLTRGDIAAVKLGQTSLEVLNADRRARLAAEPLDSIATREVDTAARATRAANEADFGKEKCA